MSDDSIQHGDRAAARRLSSAFFALVGVTFALIVLGALVRAHQAGLACPDWPMCFGQLVPEMNVQVAFEWSHRVLAGSVGIVFFALAAMAWRRPGLRPAVARVLPIAALLLATQVILGALTVWQLLASWTVTSHLVTGNAFAISLLYSAVALREVAVPPPGRPALGASARALVLATAGVLLAQMVLGGLVSSRFAGGVCPEWPTCNGGLWFPSWRGNVGLHLLHRLNAYLLLALLALGAFRHRGGGALGGLSILALGLGFAQVVVGVANVLLGIPVEVTGLHSALAAALVLVVSLLVWKTWPRPSIPREFGG